MRIIVLILICLSLLSCGTKKVTLNQLKSTNTNYSIRLKDAFLGGHQWKFGKNKKESINMYHLGLTITIDGLSEYSIFDFNDFSLLEHKNKIRHRPQNLFFGNVFNTYYIEKTNLKEFKGEDKFLKYSQAGYKNHDHRRLETNAISALTDKSNQYRFKNCLLSKKFIRKKTFVIEFYTRIKKEGEFSFYYKDRLIKKFIAKKQRTKFE